MRLYLARHGIAEEAGDDDGLQDEDRALTDEGIERTRRAAEGLRRAGYRPEYILCSPLLRARQTAEVLARVFDLPDPRASAALAPGKEPAALFRQLAKITAPRILVIGHEPGLSRLLSTSLCGDPDGLRIAFKKMAVACVAFDGRAVPGGGTIEALLPPAVLRRIRH